MVKLKTDKSVRAIWGIPINPRIEMRGYHDSLYDQVQLNPSIYRWNSPTFHYNPSSVSTDYYYLYE